LHTGQSNLDLAPGRFLALLLKAMQKNDSSATEEKVQETIDVRLALLSQLPEFALYGF
jgi:hypothetical protein